MRRALLPSQSSVARNDIYYDDRCQKMGQVERSTKCGLSGRFSARSGVNSMRRRPVVAILALMVLLASIGIGAMQ